MDNLEASSMPWDNPEYDVAPLALVTTETQQKKEEPLNPKPTAAKHSISAQPTREETSQFREYIESIETFSNIFGIIIIFPSLLPKSLLISRSKKPDVLPNWHDFFISSSITVEAIGYFLVISLFDLFMRFFIFPSITYDILITIVLNAFLITLVILSNTGFLLYALLALPIWIDVLVVSPVLWRLPFIASILFRFIWIFLTFVVVSMTFASIEAASFLHQNSRNLDSSKLIGNLWKLPLPLAMNHAKNYLSLVSGRPDGGERKLTTVKSMTRTFVSSLFNQMAQTLCANDVYTEVVRNMAISNKWFYLRSPLKLLIGSMKIPVKSLEKKENVIDLGLAMKLSELMEKILTDVSSSKKPSSISSLKKTKKE